MPFPRTSDGNLVLPATLGRYEAFGEIASGGVACVYLGRMLGKGGFERTVAIKILHRHLATDPEFVAMFLDEARLSARIRHPNVVDVYDVDALNGELFLVMEYVEGASLDRIVRLARQQTREVPLGFTLQVVRDTLLGLHAAHELTDGRGQPFGLVHRDVSPQNILVGADGIARVSDFGIAKAAGRIASTRGHDTIKGKLRYMSPEQVHNAPLDRRTDLFAAGVVLWEGLTGRHLFSGETEMATLAQVLHGTIPPPSQFAPDVPPEIDRVCLTALARDRGQRFATASAFAEALEEAGGDRLFKQRAVGEFVNGVAQDGIDRGRAMLRSAPHPPTSTSPSSRLPLDVDAALSLAPATQVGARRPLDRRALVAAAIGAFALGGALAAWLALRPSPSPVAPASTTSPQERAPLTGAPADATRSGAAITGAPSAASSAKETRPTSADRPAPDRAAAPPASNPAPQRRGRKGSGAAPFVPSDL